MATSKDDPKATADELDAAWQAGYDTKGDAAKAPPDAGDNSRAGRAKTLAFCQGRVAARADAGNLETPDGAAWAVSYLPTGGGAPKLAQTLPQLLDALDVTDSPEADQRLAVAALMVDDMWDLAPPKLRDAVHTWIVPKQPAGASN